MAASAAAAAVAPPFPPRPARAVSVAEAALFAGAIGLGAALRLLWPRADPPGIFAADPLVRAGEGAANVERAARPRPAARARHRAR